MLEKQGQVDLYPAGQNAIADILENRAAAEVSVETLTEAVAKFLAAVAIERKFAGRQQADAVYLVGGPLVSGSKVRRVSISLSNRSMR